MNNKNRFKTEGCVAVITGATAGLGREFSVQLAESARLLVLIGRRKERLISLFHEIQSRHPGLELHAFRADLALAEERERLAAFLRSLTLPVNLLVNNAGLGDLGTFGDGEWSRVESVLSVNITALTHLAHLLLPLLRSAAPAAILNVSSVAGFFPLPEMAVYAATKAYVTSFSEALRMEMAPHGVTVTALCPGPVPTEFFDVASRDGQSIRAMDRTHPILMATPSQVVSAALSGLEKEEAVVIPNGLLGLLVRAVRLLPFPLIREAIRLGVGPKKPDKEMVW